jgi:hypothetical protein
MIRLIFAIAATLATSPACCADLTQAQLDQLVAPVALYPDPVLADIFAAATYPLEIVQADRWVGEPAHADLTGDALAAALAPLDWDPSVQALVPFPKTLAMMDDHLDWTEHLGEAVLAQRGDVMAAVQRLRQRAQAAGTLKSSSDQSVINEGSDIAIAPLAPQDVYVPTYDPWCVYGTWPDPAQAPYYFVPPTATCDASDNDVAYDDGVLLPYDYVPWGGFDWINARIRVDRGAFGQQQAGGIWHHDPAHHVGAPYHDPRNAARFQRPQLAAEFANVHPAAAGSVPHYGRMTQPNFQPPRRPFDRAGTPVTRSAVAGARAGGARR